MRTLHPKIHVDADKLFIHDGPIWTSAGVTAGIDLTLALIEEDFGHRVAIETARQLVMFIKRSGGQSQFSVPLEAQSGESGTFADLHAWTAGNLAEDLRVERLAEQAGMSPRPLPEFTRLNPVAPRPRWWKQCALRPPGAPSRKRACP